MDEQELAQIDQQLEKCQAASQIASSYRTMCQTAGFLDLRRELENRIADLKNKWLTADEEEAKKIKIRAQVYNEVFDIIKGKILTGDQAARKATTLLEEKQTDA